MSVTNFYNIRLVQRDRSALENDILSALRKSYFENFQKIKDRITVDSESDTVSYEYTLEKDRAMKWLVRDKRGYVMEESKSTEPDRYVISVYHDGALFKRMVFSKFHTLLKVEYFDAQSGESVSSLEPRRGPTALCILLKSIDLAEPMVLYEAPAADERVLKMVDESFTEYYAEASTDEGMIRYMSTKQLESFKELIASAKEQIAESEKPLYLSDEDAPLAERLNVKDFNIKRNLSSSIDITKAEEFICEYEDMDDEVIIPELSPESSDTSVDEPSAAQDHQDLPENVEEASDILAQKIMGVLSDTQTKEVKDPGEPDKVISTDGASFYYYGELDSRGNRSGYGRTVTKDGRTAYEGCYLDDQRSGQGAYYYKDGGLCYAGDWEENRRSGVGVGVSSSDGSLHVGRWVDNRPKGNGARFSSDGNIKFVCKETEDKKTFLFNFMPDDSVIIAQYDDKGKKIGEKTVSLTDLIK
ncbi:MAG: hypothetical protein IJH32_06550 [Ruminococcus sp.]|nr:hypothetical protein [Ruminococcus sp.]